MSRSSFLALIFFLLLNFYAPRALNASSSIAKSTTSNVADWSIHYKQRR
jgi:hypothetical protein